MNINNIPAIIGSGGVHEALVESYNLIPPIYREIVRDIRPVSAAPNIYGVKGAELEAAGDLQPVIPGQAVPVEGGGTAHTWRLAIKPVGLAKEWDYDLIEAMSESEMEAGLADYARSLGESAARYRNQFIAGMLQKGTLTAGSQLFFNNSYPGEQDPNAGFVYDGLPWFDTAHLIAGTSYSNHNPSLALTQANLESVLTIMRSTNARNSRGAQTGGIRPTHLVVPPALEYTARRIIGSELQSGSANNDINVLRNSLTIVVNDYLTDDTDAWWVIDASRGVRIYETPTPMIEMIQVPERRVWIQRAVDHFGAAVTNWRFAYCANKSA